MLRMPEDRENELVLQAQRGSTKAFTALEKQYHWLVFKVAKDVLREVAGKAAHVEAEDVTQDVFEYAFVHIKDYKMPSRFYRWLWALAKVRALRARRKLWRQHIHESEYDDANDYRSGWDSLPSDVDEMADYLDPVRWDDYEGEEFINLIHSELSPQQKEDFGLYAKGMKPRDIAKKTGRNVRAVDKSLERAKRSAKCRRFAK